VKAPDDAGVGADLFAPPRSASSARRRCRTTHRHADALHRLLETGAVFRLLDRLQVWAPIARHRSDQGAVFRPGPPPVSGRSGRQVGSRARGRLRSITCRTTSGVSAFRCRCDPPSRDRSMIEAGFGVHQHHLETLIPQCLGRPGCRINEFAGLGRPDRLNPAAGCEQIDRRGHGMGEGPNGLSLFHAPRWFCCPSLAPISLIMQDRNDVRRFMSEFRA